MASRGRRVSARLERRGSAARAREREPEAAGVARAFEKVPRVAKGDAPCR